MRFIDVSPAPALSIVFCVFFVSLKSVCSHWAEGKQPCPAWRRSLFSLSSVSYENETFIHNSLQLGFSVFWCLFFSVRRLGCLQQSGLLILRTSDSLEPGSTKRGSVNRATGEKLDLDDSRPAGHGVVGYLGCGEWLCNPVAELTLLECNYFYSSTFQRGVDFFLLLYIYLNSFIHFSE